MIKNQIKPLLGGYFLILFSCKQRGSFLLPHLMFFLSSLSVSPSCYLFSLLWDHGNCASSVALHALPAALQEEACSNDLLLSSLATIALTINSRLAFLCGGGGGIAWAPSLELLVMCLAAVPILPLLPFHCCSRICIMDASL